MTHRLGHAEGARVYAAKTSFLEECRQSMVLLGIEWKPPVPLSVPLKSSA